MSKSKVWWIVTSILIVFILAIIISAEENKIVVDYTDYEQGTIVQTDSAIRVDGQWYSFKEWNLTWKNNNPVLTKKNTHSFLGEAEVWVGIIVGFIALGTGTYAYISREN